MTGGQVLTVSVAADGQNIAAGSADNRVYYFLSHGKLLWSDLTADQVASVSVSADGQYVAVGSLDDTVYFFTRDENVSGILPQQVDSPPSTPLASEPLSPLFFVWHFPPALHLRRRLLLR